MRVKRRIYYIARTCRNVMRRMFNPIKKNLLLAKLQLYPIIEHENNANITKVCVSPFIESSCNDERTSEFGIDLSLVIPVYNAEQFICRCIESIVSQETNYTYEVILINDGSTDNSYERIRPYCNGSNIRYYYQENHGIAYTRNRGLRLSRGKYVGFIDNDDYVEKDYVERLLKRAYISDADVVKCGHEMILKDGNPIIFCQQDASYHSDFSKHVTEYNGYIWGGISKKILWDKISFPEGFWYEDMTTRFFLYLRAQKFEYVGDVLYHKYEHSRNASRAIWSNASEKCLDQVFLVELIMAKCNEIDVQFKTPLLRSVLREYGLLLYQRCKGRYLKNAFDYASKTLRSYIEMIEYTSLELSEEENYLLKALLSNNYGYYKIVIKYLKCL